MAEQATCTMADRELLAERYVAGTLEATSLDEFESHFLTCTRCQDTIALMLSVRTAMRGMARITPLPVAPPRETPERARRRMRIVTTVGVLLAAGFAGIAAIRWNDVRSVQALGSDFVPPAYGGVPVRGAQAAADSVFAAGMAAYVRGEYATAARALRPLTETDPAPAPAFFLGASLLMLHAPAAADSAFARVIAAAPNPYVREATYYRALARLQLGDRATATRELEIVASQSDSLGATARRLLHRVEGRRTP